ncbi:MAG TPA: glycerol kinase GlpK [Steroidobacteraceae bacterium]|nr:glycerol kinase GlpK [Steroidobacteraceae bacterium]
MDRYIGAIDQGTTSTRFMVFDRRGEIICSARREHAQIHPQPGWVEHDALEILRNTQEVIETALRGANLTARNLLALGITNQRETTILWDRQSGMPLSPALVWQDTRTEPIIRELAGGSSGATAGAGVDRFRAKTGLPLASYFSASKLRWLLNEIGTAQTRARDGEALFGTVDSWLIWNLTGGPAGGLHITDVSNASRTQLMNLSTLDWDAELLAAFDIPAACLPRIRSSSEVYAPATLAAVRGVSIAGILGDQQAALVGQACFDAGEAKNTYGTGCFLLMNTGTRVVHSSCGLVSTIAYRFGSEPPRYALEGSVAVAGALVQWLRDNLRLIGHSADIEALARQVQDNGDVYFVPAFSGLFAPYWNAGARGIIAGLTAFANRGHIARAALEATAYQTRDVLEAMSQEGRSPVKELRVDGGMVLNDLLMQFQADILDLPVVTPATTETTALGAAYAAGLAVGYWDGIDALRANWRIARRWLPAMSQSERVRLCGSWKKAVQRCTDWLP